MREPDEGEEDGADEEEGTEKAEVTKGCCTEGNECQESTNGGDVSDYQRLDDFFQSLTHITCMIQMGNEVQGVVNSDTHNNRRDADDNDRHLLMHPRQTGDGEDPPPAYRQGYQQNMPQTAQEEPEQQEYQHRCQTDG